jgi:hypothetical protein
MTTSFISIPFPAYPSSMVPSPAPNTLQLTDLLSRSSSRQTSNSLHKSDESERKARALREIEADRQLVKDRVERERIVRELREKARLEAEAKAKAEEQEQEQDQEEANGVADNRDVKEEKGSGNEGEMMIDSELGDGEYRPEDGRLLGTGRPIEYTNSSQSEEQGSVAGPGDHRPRHGGRSKRSTRSSASTEPNAHARTMGVLSRMNVGVSMVGSSDFDRLLAGMPGSGASRSGQGGMSRGRSFQGEGRALGGENDVKEEEEEVKQENGAVVQEGPNGGGEIEEMK